MFIWLIPVRIDPSHFSLTQLQRVHIVDGEKTKIELLNSYTQYTYIHTHTYIYILCIQMFEKYMHIRAHTYIQGYPSTYYIHNHMICV